MTRDRDNPSPGGAAGAPPAQEPRRLVDDPATGGAWPSPSPSPPSPSSLSSSEFALDLLRAAAPYQSPPGRRQRVQLGLGHPRARRVSLTLRAAVVAAVIVAFAAGASAGLGRRPRWIAQAYQLLVPPEAPAAPPSKAPAASHTAPAAAAEPARPAPPDEAVPAPAPTPLARGAVVPRTAHPIAPRAAASNEDTSPVLEAVRALRVDGDPPRARALLARYLDRHPRGVLAEEALALSIEAAVSHRDADAAALAARYIETYPDGHFLALARQAAGPAASHPENIRRSR